MIFRGGLNNVFVYSIAVHIENSFIKELTVSDARVVARKTVVLQLASGKFQVVEGFLQRLFYAYVLLPIVLLIKNFSCVNVDRGTFEEVVV